MKNNLGKHLLHSITHNFGMKILALLFSCVLWFVVNNITDPADSKNFANIPVEIINADKITNEGKIYEILDGTDVINVKVKGKTSVLKYITKDDIKATADMSELTFMNTVSIKVTSNRNNSELEFITSNDNVKLAIEDIKRLQLAINTATTGHPADGYIVGNIVPSQNVVRLSGPESVIDKIDHVSAIANIGNYAYSSDINTSVDLQLFDKDGNEINSNAVKMNISSINVEIAILATKDIPLKFSVTGEPAPGYMVSNEVVSVPETIKIAGRKSVLDSISEMTVSDDSLDVTGKNSDMTTIVNVKKLLPANVQFADSSFNGNVSVTIPVKELITKTFEVPKRNFAIANTPEGFEAVIEEFEDKDVTSQKIEISGTKEHIDALKEKDIIGIVDFNRYAQANQITEWAEGTYPMEIVFNLSEDYKITTTYGLNITIKEKE